MDGDLSWFTGSYSPNCQSCIECARTSTAAWYYRGGEFA
jgi:hypothetical protein